MVPLDESNAIGQSDNQSLRNIIATVLAVAIRYNIPQKLDRVIR